MNNLSQGRNGEVVRDWRGFLSAEVVRNAAAEVEPEVDGCVTVSVRVNRPGWMPQAMAWLMGMKPRRKVKLDELGSVVWRQCKERTSVEALVDSLAQSEELTFHEARVALTILLEELVRRGVLVLVVTAKDEEGAEA